jgi:hypothetical protein
VTLGKSAAESQAAAIDTAQFMKSEAEDSWRRSAHRENLFALITSPWRRSFEKWQADCDSGAGHLLAIIKPKIVRHTIILSTNNLFLLTAPTSPSRRLVNSASKNSFASKFSFEA